MTVWSYLVVLRDRYKEVLACIVAGTLLAGAVSAFIPREYSSTVTMYISATGDSPDPTAAYQGGLLSEQRVKSYVQLLQSERLATDVMRKLSRPGEPSELADEIEAESSPDTVLVSATTRGNSPTEAVVLANAVGASFVELVRDLERPERPGQSATVVARIVEPGTEPLYPTVPRPLLYLLIGALLGTFTGVLLALLRNTLDNTVKTTEKLEKVSGLPVLGSIPKDARFQKDPDVMSADPGSSTAEEVRKVRTNLRFFNPGQQWSSLLVTSSLPGEGKTTTSLNLALAASRGGARVILVDADLRHPSVAPSLGLDGSVGLSNLLIGQISPGEASYAVSETLDVIASGPVPPNPAELLASDNMVQLLSELQSHYDLIVVDAPPVLPVADALALSTATDGVLMVCRAASTKIAQMQESIRRVSNLASKPIAIVLSMDTNARPQAYGKYYGVPEGAAAASPPATWHQTGTLSSSDSPQRPGAKARYVARRSSRPDARVP